MNSESITTVLLIVYITATLMAIGIYIAGRFYYGKHK